MGTVRVSNDQAKSRKGRFDRAKVAATTEQQIEQMRRADGAENARVDEAIAHALKNSPLSVRLDPATIRKLDVLAEHGHRTRAGLLAHIVQLYVAEHDPERVSGPTTRQTRRSSPPKGGSRAAP